MSTTDMRILLEKIEQINEGMNDNDSFDHGVITRNIVDIDEVNSLIRTFQNLASVTYHTKEGAGGWKRLVLNIRTGNFITYYTKNWNQITETWYEGNSLEEAVTAYNNHPSEW